MTRMAVAGCMALAALSAVAVLDVGSTTAQAEPSVSPFAGSWSGTFSVANTEDPDVLLVGTFEWTISDAGQIKGTFYNTTLGFGGTHVGHVDEDGKLLMVHLRPGDGGGFPHQGTAVIDGDGNLVVSATDTWSRTHIWSGVLERN